MVFRSLFCQVLDQRLEGSMSVPFTTGVLPGQDSSPPIASVHRTLLPAGTRHMGVKVAYGVDLFFLLMWNGSFFDGCQLASYSAQSMPRHSQLI